MHQQSCSEKAMEKCVGTLFFPWSTPDCLDYPRYLVNICTPILYNHSELQSEVLNRMKGLLAAHLISLSNREFQILVVIWNLLLQRVPRVS